MTKQDIDRSRREFLGLSLKLGFGAAAIGSLSDMGLAFGQRSGGLPPPNQDYKALVCVFMYGGNDGFNLLVPRSNPQYQEYANARQNLAIPQASLLPITPVTQSSVQFGLHPSATGLRDLFQQRKLSFVSNVGSLIVPTTRAQFQADSVPLPVQLFSHSDQQIQWQIGRSNNIDGRGWGGRISEAMTGINPQSPLSMNISLTGSNVFQTAAQTPYTLGVDGPITLEAMYGPGDVRRRQTFEALLNQTQGSALERKYGTIQKEAMQIRDVITNALAAAPTINTPFPSGELGQQLHMVARMISIRQTLGVRRQIFFVGLSGFDTHDAQNQQQPGLFNEVSSSLQAFQTSLGEILAERNVVTFSASDFGRTLTSNGDGTDHGWGSHAFVLGKPVIGGEVFGTFPRLLLEGPDDAGSGRIIPTTSIDQYGATIARWFGVRPNKLREIFPNIVNFPTPILPFLG
jgi:uncharacterized protein (DUF1501 family)